jgi:hypothetical protein
MKKLQQLCAATTLLFVLSVSVLAGNIHTNVVNPPPPPPEAATTTEPGHIGTDATTDSTQNLIESGSLVTEITLSLLQLLSVV